MHATENGISYQHDKNSNKKGMKVKPTDCCVHTCVSDKFNACANAFLSAPTTYWLLSNACSNFNNCPGENAVRTRFGFLNGCNRKSVETKKKETKKDINYEHFAI